LDAGFVEVEDEFVVFCHLALFFGGFLDLEGHLFVFASFGGDQGFEVSLDLVDFAALDEFSCQVLHQVDTELL